MMRWILIISNLVAPIAFVGLWLAGHFWWGLGCLFVAHMLALMATLIPSCRWWGPITTRVDPESDTVWLTIDDGPDPEDTPAILRLLSAHDAKATFFVIGEKAEQWPELIESIRKAGHAVENHTMTHPKFSFWRLGARALRKEISEGQKTIARISGVQPKWFRAPAGMRNFLVHRILRDLDLSLLGWSARGRDGVSTDRDAIVNRLARGIEPGAILLMHEGMRDSEGRSVIVDTLPRVLEVIRSRNLRVVVPEST